MTTQANITAFDGAATPVSHTLVPRDNFREDKTKEQVAVWSEIIPTVPQYAQIKVIQRKRKLPSGVTRVVTRVEVPIMEAVNAQNAQGYTAAPKVAYTEAFEIVGYSHERSTIAGRRLARQLALNVAGGVSTTVAPVTVGPAPELFDQLVFTS